MIDDARPEAPERPELREATLTRPDPLEEALDRAIRRRSVQESARNQVRQLVDSQSVCDLQARGVERAPEVARGEQPDRERQLLPVRELERVVDVHRSTRGGEQVHEARAERLLIAEPAAQQGVGDRPDEVRTRLLLHFKEQRTSRRESLRHPTDRELVGIDEAQDRSAAGDHTGADARVVDRTCVASLEAGRNDCATRTCALQHARQARIVLRNPRRIEGRGEEGWRDKGRRGMRVQHLPRTIEEPLGDVEARRDVASSREQERLEARSATDVERACLGRRRREPCRDELMQLREEPGVPEVVEAIVLIDHRVVGASYIVGARAARSRSGFLHARPSVPLNNGPIPVEIM